jgi:hypothetical protein
VRRQGSSKYGSEFKLDGVSRRKSLGNWYGRKGDAHRRRVDWENFTTWLAIRDPDVSWFCS